MNLPAEKFAKQLEGAKDELSRRCGREIGWGDPFCVWQMHPDTHKKLLAAFRNENLPLAFEDGPLLGSNVMAWGVEEVPKMLPGTIRLAMTSNLA